MYATDSDIPPALLPPAVEELPGRSTQQSSWKASACKQILEGSTGRASNIWAGGAMAACSRMRSRSNFGTPARKSAVWSFSTRGIPVQADLRLSKVEALRLGIACVTILTPNDADSGLRDGRAMLAGEVPTPSTTADPTESLTVRIQTEDLLNDRRSGSLVQRHGANRACWRVANYDPAPYGGPVILIRPEDRTKKRGEDKTCGWGLIAPDLQVHEVPGNHRPMFEGPNVAILRHVLREMMEGEIGGHATLR